MNDIKEKIHNLLSINNELVDMLALNSPFNNPSANKERIYSLLPWGVATEQTNTPFLTIQGGGENRISNTFFTNLIYIKVYNSTKKTFYDIDTIINKVIDLIQFKEIDLDTKVCVKIVRESVSSEFKDEALNKNYKEITFRLYML